MNENTMPRELEWDDVIEHDGQEFVLLPEGDYGFVVVALEKTRHTPQPGGKIPPCNKAILTLRMQDDEERNVDIKYNLFLHSSQEWKLCEFFAGIGLRKKGEPLRMNWSTVVGSSGTCHVRVRKYTKRDGSDGESNDVTRFYAKDTEPEFTEGTF